MAARRNVVIGRQFDRASQVVRGFGVFGDTFFTLPLSKICIFTRKGVKEGLALGLTLRCFGRLAFCHCFGGSSASAKEALQH